MRTILRKGKGSSVEMEGEERRGSRERERERERGGGEGREGGGKGGRVEGGGREGREGGREGGRGEGGREGGGRGEGGGREGGRGGGREGEGDVQKYTKRRLVIARTYIYGYTYSIVVVSTFLSHPLPPYPFSPASDSYSNNGSCMLLEGSIHSCHGCGLNCIDGCGSQLAHFIKLAAMEHCSLSFQGYFAHHSNRLNRIFP